MGGGGGGGVGGCQLEHTFSCWSQAKIDKSSAWRNLSTLKLKLAMHMHK